ncbi:Nucleolar protein 16 [Coemansia spiralis]|uniref:Nucleolar protein 16 n=2 Tax=Coemansia TaxID=4863 RepID=A0A9W8G932_9FUNG|nr:ribosome biogenesis protein Nop16 [Coemansia spiralis]KAJ1990030.1 Nucleolar protein 16 [Coemansia umbellata]KAJ2622167.1 Nucleolar protein 16 [Coemansia sp. RSA 1358]KAJ2678378.1 Nucleolar protein 16 [Coemansia spiralis]
MVRPIARKKLRNPKLKVSRKRANKARNKKFQGHPLLRDKWDSSLTVSENYRNLGLVSRLNGVTGGVVKNVIPAHKTESNDEAAGSGLKSADDMTAEELRKSIPQGYGIIERDEEGNIINVIMAEDPQNPLDSDYEVEKVTAKKEGAKILEEYANSMEERKERWISQGERRKLQNFIDVHGTDYNAMFWDKDLNKQQLTKRQIQKKIEKYLTDKEKALGPFPE